MYRNSSLVIPRQHVSAPGSTVLSVVSLCQLAEMEQYGQCVLGNKIIKLLRIGVGGGGEGDGTGEGRDGDSECVSP